MDTKQYSFDMIIGYESIKQELKQIEKAYAPIGFYCFVDNVNVVEKTEVIGFVPVVYGMNILNAALEILTTGKH